MVDEINETQKLVLELIKRASFNNFNGRAVVDDLIKNKHLWRAVVMDREGYDCIDLIKLRDLPDDFWNVDTLFILPEKGKEDDLLLLSTNWKADEVKWIGGKKACDMLGIWTDELEENDKLILSLWWD